MLRIKLFALFIAYAVVALVRPRKMVELLEHAFIGAAAVRRESLRAAIHHNGPPNYSAATEKLMSEAEGRQIDECTLPLAGWRCTRRAGHDGPCAAVAK